MSTQEEEPTVVEFPKDRQKETKQDGKRGPSSLELIWGKSVASHGYVAVPALLVRAQHRLGLNAVQMNIIVQLLDYWRDPGRKPYPSKQELSDRIGVGPKAIQVNVRALETNGLIWREKRRTVSGDWNSNIYHLDKLIERLQALEPEFQAAREARDKATKDAKDAVVPARIRTVRASRGRT